MWTPPGLPRRREARRGNPRKGRHSVRAGRIRGTKGSVRAQPIFILHVHPESDHGRFSHRWKSPSNPFRGNPWKVTGVPTIIRVKDVSVTSIRYMLSSLTLTDSVCLGCEAGRERDSLKTRHVLNSLDGRRIRWRSVERYYYHDSPVVPSSYKDRRVCRKKMNAICLAPCLTHDPLDFCSSACPQLAYGHHLDAIAGALFEQRLHRGQTTLPWLHSNTLSAPAPCTPRKLQGSKYH